MKRQRNHRGHINNLTTENTEKDFVHSERLYRAFYIKDSSVFSVVSLWLGCLCVLCGFF